MKRLLDIVISFLSLVILFPLFVVIAALVMVTSPGGVFFRGVRVGQYGKPFRIYKFRSMVKDAEEMENGMWETMMRGLLPSENF